MTDSNGDVADDWETQTPSADELMTPQMRKALAERARQKETEAKVRNFVQNFASRQ